MGVHYPIFPALAYRETVQNRMLKNKCQKNKTVGVICHAEACRVVILFIGVSLQTYFITPCALEFFGCVGSGCPLSGALASSLALAL